MSAQKQPRAWTKALAKRQNHRIGAWILWSGRKRNLTRAKTSKPSERLSERSSSAIVPKARFLLTARITSSRTMKLKIQRTKHKRCAPSVGRSSNCTACALQVTGLESCQCRKAGIQRNHIACALPVRCRFKELMYQTKCPVYQIKHGQLSDYLIEQLKNPSVKMRLA